MIGDAIQDMAWIELGIEIVEFGRAEQAVNCRGAFAAAIWPSPRNASSARPLRRPTPPTSGLPPASVSARCWCARFRDATGSQT